MYDRCPYLNLLTTQLCQPETTRFSIKKNIYTKRLFKKIHLKLHKISTDLEILQICYSNNFNLKFLKFSLAMSDFSLMQTLPELPKQDSFRRNWWKTSRKNNIFSQNTFGLWKCATMLLYGGLYIYTLRISLTLSTIARYQK